MVRIQSLVVSSSSDLLLSSIDQCYSVLSLAVGWDAVQVDICLLPLNLIHGLEFPLLGTRYRNI